METFFLANLLAQYNRRHRRDPACRRWARWSCWRGTRECSSTNTRTRRMHWRQRTPKTLHIPWLDVSQRWHECADSPSAINVCTAIVAVAVWWYGFVLQFMKCPFTTVSLHSGLRKL